MNVRKEILFLAWALLGSAWPSAHQEENRSFAQCTSLFLTHQRCRETSIAQCAVHRSIIFISWMSSSLLLAINIDLEFWVGKIILNLKFDLKSTKSTSFFNLWNVGDVNISSQRVDPTEAFQSIMNCRKSNIPVFNNRISMRFGISFTLMANFLSFDGGQHFLIDNFYDLQTICNTIWSSSFNNICHFSIGERSNLCSLGNGCEATFPTGSPSSSWITPSSDTSSFPSSNSSFF